MLKEFFQKAGPILSQFIHGDEYTQTGNSLRRAQERARQNGIPPEKSKDCRQLEAKLDSLRSPTPRH